GAVEPDPGRVAERLPRRLGLDVRGGWFCALRLQPLLMVGQIDARFETVLELRIEVHLADRRRVITRVAQEFRQRHFAFGKRGRELRDTDCPRVTPRQKRLPRSGADRRIAERPVKSHSRDRQGVDAGCPHDLVAVRPADIRRMIVGTNPEDVGPVGGRGEGNACLRSKENEDCSDRKSKAMSHGPFPRFLSTPISDSRHLRVGSCLDNSLQARRRSSRSTILHPCGPLPNKLSRFSPTYSFSRVLSDSLIRVIRVNSWARLSCPRITRMT